MQPSLGSPERARPPGLFWKVGGCSAPASPPSHSERKALLEPQPCIEKVHVLTISHFTAKETEAQAFPVNLGRVMSSVYEVSLSQSPGTPEVGWRPGEAGRKLRKPQAQDRVTNLKSHLPRSDNTLGEGMQEAGHSGIVERVW